MDEAIDQINLLIKLRQGEPIHPDLIPILTARAPTPVSASVAVGSPAPSTAGVKRKHRVSVSASPAPSGPRDGLAAPLTTSRHASPMPTGSNKGGAAGGGGGGGTPMSRQLTRKDSAVDQLPLPAGRKVAFRVPNKAGESESEEQDWILAKVLHSLGDKNRYEVQDWDDASAWVSISSQAYTLSSCC